MKHQTTIITAFLALAAANPASAAVSVSNLGETSSGSIGFAGQVATSFTTGSELPSWSLESVAIAFTRSGGTTADSITVSIHSDSGGVPGATFANLIGGSITVPGTYTFTPTSATNLAASTTYWLVLMDGNALGDTTGWQFTNSDAESSALPGWSIGNDLYANTAGWVNDGPQTGLFAVNVVPEPSAVLLGGLGALGLLARRRRA